jgi:ribosome-binding factor A
MRYRTNRLAEELKNEISVVISQEVRDPRMGFVTVTDVKVSSDLRYARIFISVFGNKEEQRQTIDALADASGFIRRQIGARIKLRYTPELTFAYDESVEQGDRMMQLIEDIKKESPEEGMRDEG